MKPTRSSKTAAQMALSRALEARRPAARRICDDPLAERLLDRGYRMALPARPLVERVIESMFPGHHHYVLARTRFLDDFLREQLTPEVAQLVILGAGFDTRAHRFADRLRGARVFEIDHPATSRTKQARIARALGVAAAPVTYVPVDFDRHRLRDELARAGFRAGARTIFLWEGVTPYVSAAGVAATLDVLRTTGAPGSVVVFDYVLDTVIDGTCDLRGARNERDRMLATPEPFVFGIGAGAIDAYLSARGFADVHDVGADELTARYLSPLGRRQYVKPWWRIAHARIA